MSSLWEVDRASALALPPFSPPLRPSATAAGSFALGAFCPVVYSMMSNASVFVSRRLTFFAILPA